jgi:hypothetical protein
MRINTDALTVLERCTVDGNKLFLPAGQLDRKLYEAVNKALVAMGGKWNTKDKAHLFAEDPTELLEQALLTGEVLDVKHELQYFPTPTTLAERMLELAFPDGCAGRVLGKVLEPSAGEGAIAQVLYRAGYRVTVCERHPSFRLILDAMGCTLLPETDFLLVPSDPYYDAVVANPPFSRQQDIDHVSHMLDMLAPGGRLVTIMSAGVTFRTNKKTTDFLARLHTVCRDVEIERLPEGTFKSAGTLVNTVLVTATKR